MACTTTSEIGAGLLSYCLGYGCCSECDERRKTTLSVVLIIVPVVGNADDDDNNED